MLAVLCAESPPGAKVLALAPAVGSRRWPSRFDIGSAGADGLLDEHQKTD
jgi:hypothetical protein